MIEQDLVTQLHAVTQEIARRVIADSVPERRPVRPGEQVIKREDAGF
jgi:hypothetical protein